MRASKLRHRIKLQKQVGVQDITGGVVTSWQDVNGYTSVPSKVESLSGNALIAAQAIKSKVVARIVIRPCVIDETYRILHGTHIYDIQAVLPDADSGREYYTLLVSRGMNDG